MAGPVRIFECDITLRGLRVRAGDGVPRELLGRVICWSRVRVCEGKSSEGTGFRVFDGEGAEVRAEGRRVMLRFAGPYARRAALRAQYRYLKRHWETLDPILVERYSDQWLLALGGVVGLVAVAGGLMVVVPPRVIGNVFRTMPAHTAVLVLLPLILILWLDAWVMLPQLRRLGVNAQRVRISARGIVAEWEERGTVVEEEWSSLRAIRLRYPCWDLDFADGVRLRLPFTWRNKPVLEIVRDRWGDGRAPAWWVVILWTLGPVLLVGIGMALGPLVLAWVNGGKRIGLGTVILMGVGVGVMPLAAGVVMVGMKRRWRRLAGVKRRGMGG